LRSEKFLRAGKDMAKGIKKKFIPVNGYKQPDT